MAARAAATDAPVLIEGEPGTGKSLVAQAIHHFSRRSAGPLVRVACGALRESEVDEKLFGQDDRQAVDRQASMGRQVPARIASLLLEQAHAAPFLDGVCRLPLWAQVKLLDAVRSGGNGKALDLRIIASASSDLAEAIAQRLFDSALYYQLNVVRLCIPPLRTRPQDIKALAEHFLTTLAGGHQPRAALPLVQRGQPSPVAVRLAGQCPAVVQRAGQCYGVGRRRRDRRPVH